MLSVTPPESQSRRPGSHRHRPPYEGGALLCRATSAKKGCATGIEPVPLAPQASVQPPLHHEHHACGGKGGSRTRKADDTARPASNRVPSADRLASPKNSGRGGGRTRKAPRGGQLVSNQLPSARRCAPPSCTPTRNRTWNALVRSEA